MYIICISNLTLDCNNTDILFFYHFSGGYDKEERAARAYDLAALKYWGPATTTNFPVRC